MKKKKVSNHITQPKYLLGHSEEINALWEITNNGQEILKCRSFEDFTNLCIDLRKDHNLGLTWNSNTITGIVFGQSFFNYFLVRAGSIYGIVYKHPASKSQDTKEATDTWVVDKHGDWVRVNLKWQVEKNSPIKFEKYATYLGQMGIDWANDNNYKVLIVDGQIQADWKLDNWLEQTNSLPRIGAPAIENFVGTGNKSFFQDFYDMLEENVDYFEKKRLSAVQKADQKRKEFISSQDSLDKQDIQTLKDNEKGAGIACPGWSKTALSAFGSIEPRLERGPIYYVSRVKGLVEQNMTEVVELVRPMPGRLLIGSFDDHVMDAMTPLAVGSLNIHRKLIEDLHTNKTPCIIGAVTYGSKTTLNQILDMHIDKQFPLRMVIDEALELFLENARDSLDEDEAREMMVTFQKLETLQTMGLLETLHVYDAIFVDGLYGMNSPLLGMPKDPLFNHSHLEGQNTNRLVPIKVIHHWMPEALLNKYKRKKQFKGMDENQILEMHGTSNVWNWIQHNVEVPKLLNFNSNVDNGRKVRAEIDRNYQPQVSGEIFANTTPPRRRSLQQHMNDPAKEVYVGNYNITAKGMNYNILEDIVVAPDKVTSEGLAWHTNHRQLRRAPGERGLPLSECKKQEGRLHLVGVKYDDGTMSPSMRINIERVEKMQEQGMLVVEQHVEMLEKPQGKVEPELPNLNDEEDSTFYNDEKLTKSFIVIDVPNAVQTLKKASLENNEILRVNEIIEKYDASKDDFFENCVNEMELEND